MNNRGSIYGGILIFYAVLFVIFMMFGITMFQTVFISEVHNIKNDLYMINRNVLLALQRDIMGEDKYAFYEQDVKQMVADEIKRQWNTDVSTVSKNGFIKKVDIVSAQIINKKDEMLMESILDIQMRPVVFQEALKDKLCFTAKEVVKVKKMKGWNDE